MKDWREGLKYTPQTTYKAAAPASPHLCNCKANMKGKWIDGVYTCVRCNKRVYDAFNS